MNKVKFYIILCLFVGICTISLLHEQLFEKGEICGPSTHIQYQILAINYNQKDPSSSITKTIRTSIFGQKKAYTISPNLCIRLESWISSNQMITMDIGILLLKQVINTQVRTKAGEPVLISSIVKNRRITICITPRLISSSEFIYANY